LGHASNYAILDEKKTFKKSFWEGVIGLLRQIMPYLDKKTSKSLSGMDLFPSWEGFIPFPENFWVSRLPLASQT